MNTFTSIVVGAGQAASPLAHFLAGKGEKIAVIEKEHVGGSCVNYGCTPTKAMIASAKAAYRVKNAGKLGVNARLTEVDFQKVIARRDEIVEKKRKGNEKGYRENENISLIYGTATFSGEKEIEVQQNGKTEKFRADKIFINTGSYFPIPPIDGIEEVNYFTAKTMMSLRELPSHLLIIGSGYIGLEFAQMYHRFGSKVTVLEASPEFLTNEDEDIAAEVLKTLEEEGVKIILNARITRAGRQNEGISLKATVGKEEKQFSGSHLLIAAGTKAATDDLGLDKAGIDTDDKGAIKVNEHLQTSAEGIYALGNVTGGMEFTHLSYDDFRVVRDHLSGGSHTAKDRLVPYVMFTDPELGRVGITEKIAKEKGINYEVAKIEMSKVARAIENAETRGLAKIIYEADSGKILGATILGLYGGEVMALVEMAMLGGIKYPDFKEIIFAHPTMAEMLNNI